MSAGWLSAEESPAVDALGDHLRASTAGLSSAEKICDSFQLEAFMEATVHELDEALLNLPDISPLAGVRF